MRTADEALSREVERGMTRQDILRRAAALGIVVTSGTFGPLTEAAFASTQIKRGGTFRQATAGGTTDFIDGQHIVAKSDIVRLVATFDALARFDEKGNIKLHLAEELKAEKANQYLIRVRKGVEFHNGKTLTIDDVIYSIRRTKNPKLKLFGNAAFGAIDLERHQEARQVDVPALPVAARRHADGGVRPVLPGRRPEGLPAERGRQGPVAVHRDRAVQGQELHSRTRERPREERELLDRRPAVLQRGADHQLPLRRGQGQRAAVRAGRGDGGRPVRAGARREGSREEDPRLPDRRVDAAVHAGRHRALRRRARAAGVPPPHQPPAGRAAGPLRLRVRRERHLLAVRSRVRGRRVPAAQVRPRAGKVSAEAGRTRQPLRRARHESRGHRDGRGRDDLRAEREGRRRQRHRPERRRRHDLRRPVPEVAVLGGLLGDAQLPPPGRDGRPQDGPVQRDALGRVLGLPQVRGALPAGPGDRRQQEARADHQGDAAHGVQRRRAHHLGLQEPDRRLLRRKSAATRSTAAR